MHDGGVNCTALIVKPLVLHLHGQSEADAPLAAFGLGKPPEDGVEGIVVFAEVAVVTVGEVHRLFVVGHGGEHTDAVVAVEAVEQVERLFPSGVAVLVTGAGIERQVLSGWPSGTWLVPRCSGCGRGGS